MISQSLSRWLGVLLLASGMSFSVFAAEPNQEPLLRIEAGGPTSYVTSLAFNADGSALFAGGWDKVVRVWGQDTATGQYQLSDRAAYRIPIGPGTGGNINAIALSGDGNLLAIAGRSLITGEAGFRERGIIWPKTGTLTDAMRADEGLIYLYDTQTRNVRTLRGHKGPVLSLTFAPEQAGKTPLLISVGLEGEEGAERRAVAYLWDAATGTYVDGHFLSSPRGMRPPIAAWHTGKQTNQIRIVVALGNTSTLWDVEQRKIQPIGEGSNHMIATCISAKNLLLTSASGGIQTWTNIGAGRTPTKGALLKIADGLVPVALTAFSSKDGADLAAVLWQPQTGASSLALLDIATGKVMGKPVSLWQERKQPVLAVDQDGSHVAVSGSPDHRIDVFAVADLRAGNAVPEVLRSVGSVFDNAEFVRNGERLGLRLTKNGAKTSSIFDFELPGFKSDSEDWKSASSQSPEWKVTTTKAEKDAKGQVLIEGTNGISSTVTLGDKELFPVTAVFPAKGTGAPLVSLAVLDEGQPKLWIIDPKTGIKVRELTGHSDQITSLSFTQDGRLLASTARDQTVSVWSMTDLGETLGKLGGLPGVTVDQKEGALQIASTVAGNPLMVGMKVLGSRDVAGNIKPFQSAADFYGAFAQAKPNDTIQLQIDDSAGRRLIPVRVSQGTDERKPLFTLFTSEGKTPSERSWIGWNPVGPYEASEGADKLLGWHFNTGLVTTPTSFALANQYRKTYFQSDLLKSLVATGSYQPPPPPPPPPAPQMSLWLREEGSDQQLFGQDGFVRIQKPKGSLTLSVLKFPMERVKSAALFVDGKETDGLSRSSEREWQADLGRIAWDNQLHDLRVVIRTDETPVREFSQELSAAFQPTAPGLALVGPAEETQVQDAKYTIAFNVTPSVPDTVVRFVHKSDDKVIAERTQTVQAPGKLEESFELKPGTNVIEAIAGRAEPLEGEADAEQTRLTRVVSFDDTPSPPPRVEITRIIEGTGAEAGAYSRTPGARIVVIQPTIRIEGKITSAEPLTVAERGAVNSPDRKALAGFEAEKGTTFAFNEVFELQPGPQEIVVLGRSAKSLAGEARLSVDFRPRLPQVRIDSPADGTIINAGKDGSEIDLVGTLLPAPGNAPFQIIVMINGKALPRPPIIDGKTGKVASRVALQPGANRLQLRVSNDWSLVSKTSPVTVSYRRPPAIVEVKAPTVSEKPLIDIQATVTSPKDSPLTRLEINGHPVPLDALKLTGENEQMSTWTVDAKNVPLRAGANDLAILAWNREGASPIPGAVKLNYSMPAPPPADVELTPRLDTVVTTGRYPVGARIRSQGPILGIEIQNGRDTVYTIPTAELASLASDAAGVVEWQSSIPVDLAKGANVIRLRAINAGGEASRAVTISFIDEPVRIIVDRLDVADGSKSFAPSAQPDNTLIIAEPAPESALRVHGRVVWNDANEESEADNLLLRVYVNGFQQIPVRLRKVPGKTGERAFAADVSLNRANANLIVMDLPGVGQDQATRSTMSVQCTKPATDQQLHLLIVGLGKLDKKKLQTDAMTALEAKTAKEGEFSSPAFKQIHCYGPLTGFVGPERIVTQLERIRFNLSVRKSVNDVVMMYYQGGESVDAKGRFFLLTSASQYDPDLETSAITGEDLKSFFDMTPGAHLLLLDVARTQAGNAIATGESSSLVAQWPAESRIGLLRSTWLGGPVAPEDASLLFALREKLPGSTTGKLQDVSAGLESRFQSEKYRTSLAYDGHVPKSLVDMVIK